jgi:hypothetical protein
MIFMRITLLAYIFASYAICSACGTEQQEPIGNFKNPAAVKEVLSGKRTVANAAWWGFNKDDSTDALQGAINSGASKVIVPYMGSAWIVRPINLESNQELVFEPGVEVVAKKGEFKSTGDSLFKARNKHNITLRGYGATLRMQKRDYIGPNYEKGQWRMVLLFMSCSNVKVLGLTLRDSGGDGIYLGQANAMSPPCKDILIKDCICDNNYRQGISVISAENLHIDNCIFKNTSGHSPAAGIDLEPNYSHDKLTNIVISNCISENNEGPGFVVGLHNLNTESSDISILFYNCYVIGCKWGVQVLSNSSVGAKGLVEFRNITSENTQSAGIWVVSKTNSFGLRFAACNIRNAATKPVYPQTGWDVPIFLRINRQKSSQEAGGIEFADCYVYDDKNRPSFMARPYEESSGVLNVKGTIYVRNLSEGKVDLFSGAESHDLTINPLPR